MSDESPGATIRRARQKARMKQRELADRLGVHETTVGYWERDKFFPERHWAALNDLLHISLTPPGADNAEPPARLKPETVDDIREQLGDEKAAAVISYLEGLARGEVAAPGGETPPGSAPTGHRSLG